MKFIKTFEDLSDQIWDKDKALEVLQTVYVVLDEIPHVLMGERFADYLVTFDQFMDYVKKYNGSFASNFYTDLDDLIGDIGGISEFLNSPELDVYVSPFWMSRNVEDITEFKDVYSDTLYIGLSDVQVKRLELGYDDLESKIGDIIGSDEASIMTGTSGQKYLRIWWD